VRNDNLGGASSTNGFYQKVKKMLKELYKYRSFNEQALVCLSEGVIWVSKPSGFNDPFEYSFIVEPDMTFEDVATRNKDATKSNYLEKQNKLIDDIKKRFETGGIFSLSEQRNISLMWSHYADYHKGFCIGYEVTNDNDLGNGKCQKVHYGEYPSFSLLEMFRGVEKMDNNIAKKIFEIMVLSKDKNWRYEYEWRVLYSQSNELVIPNFKISSITFGMRMTEWQQKIIMKILEVKTSLFKAVKSKDSYNVEIIQI